MTPQSIVLEEIKPQLGRRPDEAEFIECQEPPTGTSGGVASMYLELVVPLPQPEPVEEREPTTEPPAVQYEEVVAGSALPQVPLLGPDFWQPKTIAQLIGEQAVMPMDDLSARPAWWPQEDDLDEFIQTVRRWRNTD